MRYGNGEYVLLRFLSGNTINGRITVLQKIDCILLHFHSIGDEGTDYAGARYFLAMTAALELSAFMPEHFLYKHCSLPSSAPVCALGHLPQRGRFLVFWVFIPSPLGLRPKGESLGAPFYFSASLSPL